MGSQHHLGKGEVAEEALRAYFLSLGYFVVRSVPFSYKGFDVTDVDLWLYLKSTSLTRERICVDVKRKRTPQALERIFWIKGLREVLGLDRAIVATTDNRKETRDFGARHGVIVLPGEFLQRIINGVNINSNRITEELFIQDLNTKSILDGRISWPRFYRESKAVLLNALNFNGCNLYLEKIRFLIEEYLASNRTSLASLRLLYILISYFLIAVDYSSRLLIPLDFNLRKACFAEGFRYGAAGKERAKEIIDDALYLLASSSNTGLFSREKFEQEIISQLTEYPAEILADFFAKSDNLKHLFTLARDFENLAFSQSITMPHECPSHIKGILGLLCDFLRIDRRKII
ncbi:hypothetical protein [Desulfovirgula thermocuniculi]|uniref:hypothetical protein n=1 Tax=Desulfovirgula thermocuniculi TaxID=348842 RepID=UPI0012EB24EC|nr:hypothetical protein [Desulfovirgula thermocuniculi]